MRLSEMLELAQEGDDSELMDFMRRIAGGQQPRDDELANAYDRYLFGKMAEALLPMLEESLAKAVDDAVPSLLKMQGIMGKAATVQLMARRVNAAD